MQQLYDECNLKEDEFGDGASQLETIDPTLPTEDFILKSIK